MIRMLSGLAANAIAAIGGPFRKGGRVSPYRIVLAATLAALAAGLWLGWTQWVLLGDAEFGIFAVRWLVGSWLAAVLLWPAASKPDDNGEVIGFSILVMLMISAVGTIGQGVYTHDFSVSPRTNYRAEVSCEHCGASCYAHVKIGESWTDWESVKCCRCGIRVPPVRVPEYKESREAWDARIQDRGGDGAQD